jgi:hypothetical protein
MDFNPRYELSEAAEVLEQLALLVEESGLSAGDLGELIWNSYEHSTIRLSDAAHRDLLDLRASRTTTVKFASGLRRQAKQLRDRANVVMQ